MSEIEQVPDRKLTGGEQFGMLPRSVMKRRDISGTAKVVLGGMAMESGGSGRIAISHGALGLICGCSRVTALNGCIALEKAGLIAKNGKPVGQVQPYKILHPRIAGRADSIVPARAEAPKTMPLLRCPRCSRRCRALLKIGHCRGCRWDDKVDGRIDAKLKSA